MSALNSWVEKDAGSAGGEPGAEIDVFDGRTGKAVLVEAADSFERLAPNRAEARPERRGRPRPLVVDMVVQQIAEVGHEPVPGRVVVVRAEHRGEIRIGFEGATNPSEGVRVHGHG